MSGLFAFYHNRLLKKHFYRIHLSGEEYLKALESSLPTILYANHTNWWDGFIAFQLTSRYLKVDDHLMMDIEQMRKYRFFKYVGVFSVNRDDAREGVESVKYAADLLKGTNKYLWIFPEGKMNVQDHEPIKFYSGITHLSQKIGSVNLVPVSFRYQFIMEQRPEIFIKIGAPDIVKNNITDTKSFTQYLQEKLASDLLSLKQDVISQKLDNYKTIFTGKHSRNKTVDRVYE
jgi:chlorobactene lauroyltransferase